MPGEPSAHCEKKFWVFSGFFGGDIDIDIDKDRRKWARPETYIFELLMAYWY